jgi:hypothetical protein
LANAFIPIATNAEGGIVAGLVTRNMLDLCEKIVALLFGMCAFPVCGRRMWQPEIGVSTGQITGGSLAAVSLYLHAANPPATEKCTKQD